MVIFMYLHSVKVRYSTMYNNAFYALKSKETLGNTRGDN